MAADSDILRAAYENDARVEERLRGSIKAVHGRVDDVCEKLDAHARASFGWRAGQDDRWRRLDEKLAAIGNSITDLNANERLRGKDIDRLLRKVRRYQKCRERWRERAIKAAVNAPALIKFAVTLAAGGGIGAAAIAAIEALKG